MFQVDSATVKLVGLEASCTLRALYLGGGGVRSEG